MKKILLVLSITLFASALLAQTATPPAIGDGSSGSPYQIATLDNLYWVTASDAVVPNPTQATRWAANYIQTADIDASTTSGWSGGGWSPIGINTKKFTGSYNGQDFTIDGLFIDRATTDYIGMFGFTNDAEIDNIGVTNVNFTGKNYVGGLVGEVEGSDINNCYVSGSVSGTYHIGGLAGSSKTSSTISNSHASGSVNGAENVGGMVGLINSTTVSDCYSTSTVTGNEKVGGLLGNNNGSAVNRCYASGSVSGSANNIGGLVGYNSSTTVIDSYATGSSVSGIYNVGGLVGFNFSTSPISNSYSSSSVTGTEGVGGLIGLNRNSTVNSSYATGSATGTGNHVGGLVGRNDGSATVSNSYATGGSVNGNLNVGGLVGYNDGSAVSKSYATGSATGTGTVGGLVGSNENGGTTTNSFWDTETSGQASSAGGTGKTTLEMKNVATFTDETTAGLTTAWDFVANPNDDAGNDDYWAIDGINNSGYPWLSFEGYDAVDITWDGSASADWNEKSNWSHDAVPTVQNNPIISSGVTQPVISTTGTASCNNLTVNSGATLTLQSDVSNSGSLIVSGTSTGNVTYNRWMAADKWHIVSAPVETQTINGVLTDGSGTNNIAYKNSVYGVTNYLEASNEWGNYYTSETEGNFTSGVGYLMRRQTTDGTVSFTGTVATGDVTSAVTLNGNGWNAVGNPYTSAIGVASTATSTEKFLVENEAILDDSYEALYVWDPATSDYVIINNSGTGWDVDYVQAGQGFIVRANANGNITFTTSMQKHQASQVFKSAKIPWPGLVLKANKNDEMVSTAIAFNDDMTTGLDPGYDAGIFKGDNDLNIFTQLIEDNGVEFMLQCLPLQNLETVEIQIGLDATDKGDISFSIEKNNFTETMIPVLNDKLLETKFVFTADGDVYNTTINDNTKGFGRFSLTFASTTDAEDIASKKQYFKAWFSNGKINLYGETTGTEIARVYNISGQEISNARLENTNLNTIELPIRISGIYLIRIEKQSGTEVLKVPVFFN